MPVPVEPISLTIGVVALASLFSTCVECFEYFKDSQSLGPDFDLLVVKLDFEKMRLLIWGNSSGVLQAEGAGRAVGLKNAETRKLIASGLEKIKSLLSDTDKLRKMYALEPVGEMPTQKFTNQNILSANSMNVFKTSYRRFCVRFADNQAKSTFVRRTRWAVHDKGKFELLLHHLKDLIDDLNLVLPGNREAQDQMVHDDIASILDVSKLKLVEAASERSYPAWSQFARCVREASEAGTIDRRNDEEWLMDEQGIREDDNENEIRDGVANSGRGSAQNGMSQAPLFTSIPGLSDFGHIYFVLTEQCENSSSQSSCKMKGLADTCSYRKSWIENFHGYRRNTVREFIADTISIEKFSSVNFDTLFGRAGEDGFDEDLELILPVATIYIYCGLCPHLLATAITICQDAGRRARLFFRFLIRPRVGFRSKCCSNEDGALGLRSLIDTVKNRSFPILNYQCTQDLQHWIDVQWVEQQLYNKEDLVDTEVGAGNVFSTHSSPQKDKCAGIVILGELDTCLAMIQREPFLRHPTMPRETEIYKMSAIDQDLKISWKRQFLGTYNSNPDREITVNGVQITVSAARQAHLNPIPPAAPPTTAVPIFLPTAPSLTTVSSSPQSLRRHISPPPSPTSKRQRTSPPPSSVEMDDEDQESGGSVVMQDILTTSVEEIVA